MYRAMVVVLLCAAGAGPSPSGDAEEPALLYRCESADGRRRDVVTLLDGSKAVGKALEWGTSVLLYDEGGGVRRLPAERVAGIRRRYVAPDLARPALPDLTVAFVEPTAPADGRWTLHVLNAGASEAKPFEYSISLGGRRIAGGQVESALTPGGRARAEFTVPADAAEGSLRIELDPAGANAEAARWNNIIESPLRGVGLRVIVDREWHAAAGRAVNLVDTHCLEDWVQFHARFFNRVLADSTSARLPNGVIERVRIDRIEFADEADRLAPRLADPATGRPLFVGSIRLPDALRTRSPAEAADSLDAGLLRQIGLTLGLVDASRIVAPVWQCRVRNRDGDYLQLAYRPAGPATFMLDPGPRTLSAADAAYLERMAGRTERVAGEYLAELPAECGLVVRDNSGRPLPGVDVTVFSRAAEDKHPPAIEDRELLIGTTDSRGRFRLPAAGSGGASTTRRAAAGGPWGAVGTDLVSALWLVRLRKDRSEEYHFVSLLDFVDAAANGHERSYDLALRTRLSAAPAPAPPPYVRLYFNTEHADDSKVHLLWPADGSDGNYEYRVYAKPGRSDDDWTLIDLVSPSNVRGNALAVKVPLAPFRPLPAAPFAANATTYAVSMVDARGREGPLSPTGYAPFDGQSVKLAIDRNAAAYVSTAGPLDFGLIKSNASSFHKDYGLRLRGFEGYEPWGGGVAFDRRGRLLLTDPHNHQLAFYERGDLVRLVGHPARSPKAASAEPGYFNTPSDVTVDDRGRVYVADTDNNRVQEFNERGRFVRMLDDGTKDPDLFRGPTALGYAYGMLCVTDLEGTRVQMFDVRGDDPLPKRTFRGLNQADRALAGQSGRVYVQAQNAQREWAVLIYPPGPPEQGPEVPERDVKQVARGRVRGPRGFYPDGHGYALYVTEFPYVVQRFMLE